MTKMIRNKHILITGGLGFIGSNLAEKLIEENKIVLLDNVTSGRISNLRELKRRDNIKLVRGDVKDFELVRRCADGVDLIFHLAAVVGVEQASSKPIEGLDTELIGTSNILKAALENNVQRVIYASSSEVYGQGFETPFYENSSPSPLSVYGTAKLTAELYCKAYFREFDLGTVCLRYFNVYGPRQDERFVVGRFIKNALLGLPLTVYFDGAQTRDFTFINDAINATLIAAESEKCTGESINIASGKPITINELAKSIIKIIGKGKIVYTSPSTRRLPEFEVKYRCADITKMKNLLDFQPSYTLEEGLRETIDWMMKTVNQVKSN